MSNLVLSDARDRFMQQMEASAALVKPVLPSHVKFETLLGQMQKHLRENPKLLECSAGSLFWSFVHAAEVGLTVGDYFGEAYILPFANKRDANGPKRATFVPGYKGLIKLAYQSTLVKSINAFVIYETDVFQADLGKESSPVKYEPNLRVQQPGAVIAVYTKIQLAEGFKHDILPLWKLEQIRKASPGIKNPDHPWNTHTDEMYRKTGIRHGLKDTPKSTELDRALRLDEASEMENAPEEAVDLPGFEEKIQGDDGRASKSRARVQERAQAAQLPAPKPAAAAAQLPVAQGPSVAKAPEPPVVAKPPAAQQGAAAAQPAVAQAPSVAKAPEPPGPVTSTPPLLKQGILIEQIQEAEFSEEDEDIQQDIFS